MAHLSESDIESAFYAWLDWLGSRIAHGPGSVPDIVAAIGPSADCYGLSGLREPAGSVQVYCYYTDQVYRKHWELKLIDKLLVGKKKVAQP